MSETPTGVAGGCRPSAVERPDYQRLAHQDLRANLRALNDLLRIAVERQMHEAAGLDRPEVAHLAITDRHADLMLDRVDRVVAAGGVAENAPLANDPSCDHRVDDRETRSAAERRGWMLPLDRLTRHYELGEIDRLALLACTAPEIDIGYHRLYSYVLDDINRSNPCPALLSALAAAAWGEPLTARPTLGPHGRLRRLGLVETHGDAATDLLQDLRLAPSVLEFLLGAPIDIELLTTSASGSSTVPGRAELPPHLDLERIDLLAAGLIDGRVEIVGVRGGDESTRESLVMALVERTGHRWERIALTGRTTAAEVGPAVHAAALAGGIVWLDETDEGVDRAGTATPDGPAVSNSSAGRRAIEDIVMRTSVPVLVSGSSPWRPRRAMRHRPYAEIEVSSTTHAQRCRLWERALPAASESEVVELAGRYRLSPAEIEAVVAMARTERGLGTAGPVDGVDSLAHQLDLTSIAGTIRIMMRDLSDRFTTTVTPRRCLDDLVLPPAEFRQIVEIGRFHRAWPAVTERWGFGDRTGRGVKALFVGDPGTGKTMAAEVIAESLGVPLVKVDLAQVVSKWVGETEKNLEAAFGEAESTDCVLFFDEADSLFGKRGEVRHGTDRYANLEVGYLLQRLESYEGLVILASNLHDNIDAAFGRRFTFVVHFPRPDEEQRRRLWAKAFPPQAPVADLDITALARLDLTGAGIASTAQTAALLAADQGAATIDPCHVAYAARRQFQREGRALRPSDLGPYGAFL